MRKVTLPTLCATALLALACSSPFSRPEPPNREEVVSLANTAEATRARASAQRHSEQLSRAISQAVPALKPIETGVDDSCVVGGHGERGAPNNFRLGCDYRAMFAFGADGDLLGLLAQIDAATRAAGGSSNRPFSIVEIFVRTNGKSPDGRPLSCPLMTYDLSRPPDTDHGVEGLWYRDNPWTLGVLWADVKSGPPTSCRTNSQPRPQLSASFDGPSTSTFWLARKDLGIEQMQARATGHQHVVLIGMMGSYHTVPWPR